MRPAAPFTAAAIALMLCSGARGRRLRPRPGQGPRRRSLTVTRDFGAEPLLAPVSDGVTEADTVMRVLERNADIETRYGGGFVQAIDGLEAEEGGDGGPSDWFFYVNGVESTVGRGRLLAARRRGDLVGLPPLGGGDAGARRGRLLAAAVRRRLRRRAPPGLRGLHGRRRRPAGSCASGSGAAGVSHRRRRAPTARSGSWSAPGGGSRADPAAAQIGRGPQAERRLRQARRRRAAAARCRASTKPAARRATSGPDAGLVAATRRYEAPPTWVVTGCDGARGAKRRRGCSTRPTCATVRGRRRGRRRGPIAAAVAGPVSGPR